MFSIVLFKIFTTYMDTMSILQNIFLGSWGEMFQFVKKNEQTTHRNNEGLINVLDGAHVHFDI